MLQIYEKIAEKIAHKRVFLTFLSLILIQTFALAQNDSKITIQQKNITVIDALKTVEKQSKMSINYSDSELTGKVIAQLNLQNASLETALDTILKGTGFSFQIQGNYIIIAEKKPVVAQILKNIKGKVTDESGEPLIGVNISVDGSSTGTITDFDGNFTIKAAEKSILKVSYIGYAAQIIPVSKKDFYPVVMKQDTEVLDEVVVTALGIKRAEKALSYNVQQVKGDALTTVKDANFVNSLNGKIAGVSINKSASGVGGATRVVMRGAKSIEGDNNALYVVDGIPLFNTNMGNTDSGIMGEGKAGTEGIADFNPEDIESLSVLSGPSAAALYGSSAANGVILITTKKGKEGKLSVQFSSSSEFSKAYMTPEFQNTYGNKKDMYESWGEKLLTPTSYDPKKDFFNTGTNFINSVTLTTGTKSNQTFASVSSTNSKGIVPNNEYERLNFTIRNTATFLNDKLQLDLGASYVKQKDKNMVSQGQYWNPVMAAYLFPRGEDFDGIKSFEHFDESRQLPVQYWPVADPVYASQNPYWTAYRNVATNEKSRYMFNVGLTYNITDWLNATARFRMDDTHVLFERKIYASSDDKFAEGKKGLYGYNNYEDRQEYADFMLNVNKHIADFSISANAGWNYSNYWALERGYKGTLLGVPNKFAASNIDPANGRISEKGGDSRVRNHAVFANLELGWKSMLYLTLTGRNDWNSRLVNTDEESFFYPSIGLSGIISEMVKLPEFISYLKVRGSYTEVGNSYGRFMTTVTYPYDEQTQSWTSTSSYPKTKLKPERTKSWEVGLDARILNDISLNLTYYRSNTYNQTFYADLSLSSGYSNIPIQSGNIMNEGLEMSLGYNKQWKDFSFNTNYTLTWNKNRVKRLADGVYNYATGQPIQMPELSPRTYGHTVARLILRVGGSMGVVYGQRLLKRDLNGYILNEEGVGLAMENKETYLGSILPKMNMGWSLGFGYKGVNLGMTFTGRFGGIVISETQSVLDAAGVSKVSADVRDAGGVQINQSKVSAQTYYQTIQGTAAYYTYSATNVRLGELSLSYTLPKKWFDNKVGMTVGLGGKNLWMIYCKAPFDPELTTSAASNFYQGFDAYMLPSTRNFGFNVKFQF